MKCPRCKNEVARLTQHVSTAAEYPAGLCDTCDAVERAGDAPPPRHPPVHMPGVENLGDGPKGEPKRQIKRRGRPPNPDREPPKPKRPYKRRQLPDSPGDSVQSETNLLQSLRNIYAEDLDEAEKRVDLLRIRVEVADEILAKIKAGR